MQRSSGEFSSIRPIAQPAPDASRTDALSAPDPADLPNEPSLRGSQSRISLRQVGDSGHISVSRANWRVFVKAVKDVFSSGIVRWSPIQAAKFRKSMIAHAVTLKGGQLTDQDLQSINKLLKSMKKINSARKLLLPAVDLSTAKAPWKVRKVKTLTIGDTKYELQLGRNFKALVLYNEPKKVAQGSFGKVEETGMEIKPSRGLLQKIQKKGSKDKPKDLLNEVVLPKKLHERAGGHQAGIQYAPYAITNFGSESAPRWGVLVRRYETTLDPKELLKEENQTNYGLQSKKGPARILHGAFVGLQAVHAAGMAHRDIKPQNMGIQRGPHGKPEACLADFGSSVDGPNALPPDDVTLTYLGVQDADLQNEGDCTDEQRIELQQKQDIFALARSILEISDTLIHGTESKDLSKALNKYTSRIRNDGHAGDDDRVKESLDAIGARMGPKVRDLLYRMLDPNPLNRPNAAEAAKIWKTAC